MMPLDMGKVAVLMGGLSAERAISLKSGTAVVEALTRRGVDVQGVDVDKDIVPVLQAGRFDRVFIALHGRGGEDGVIQGVLECLGIPYTGSGVLGSALSMDKIRSKQLWMAAKLPTPDYALLEAQSPWDDIVARLGLPLAVKPVHEGSSIGTTRVMVATDLQTAWRDAAQFDDQVMAEPWINGGEYTVAILGSEALPVIRLETPRTFYDYEAKYSANDTRYHCPCGLDATAEGRMQQLALAAFKALGAEAWGRVDVMLDEQGNPWLLENNTVPGMTDHSLVPMAAAARGINFDELVWRILADASLKSPRESVHGC